MLKKLIVSSLHTSGELRPLGRMLSGRPWLLSAQPLQTFGKGPEWTAFYLCLLAARNLESLGQKPLLERLAARSCSLKEPRKCGDPRLPRPCQAVHVLFRASAVFLELRMGYSRTEDVGRVLPQLASGSVSG